MEIKTYNFGGKDRYVEVTVDEMIIEGDVIIGTAERGGETYPYISHIEWDEDGLDEEFTDQVEEHLNDNFTDLITNAEKI